MGNKGIITLCSDFAEDDAYVGSMKGVILSINPDVTIIDVTHHIPRQDVRTGAYLLSTYYHLFPDGTIHICIVDPGVGSSRSPIVVQTGRYIFIAPDNGVLSFVYHQCKDWRAYTITNTSWCRPIISRTFHGRDIFAPTAAHIAHGLSPEDAGPALESPVCFEIPEPMVLDTSIEGTVIHIDTFGNVITNIPNQALVNRTFRLVVGNNMITHLSSSYAEGVKDAVIALPGSNGTIELAVNYGSAARLTGLKRDDKIVVEMIG